MRGLEHVHAKHRGHLRNDERHGWFAPLLDLADDRHGESGQVGELGLRQMTGAPQTRHARTGVVLGMSVHTGLRSGSTPEPYLRIGYPST
ncbi:hypothetical protein [Streptomyces sp. NBC_01361]|uniref:hypothetical protein n=1 Tax=Streptomyces sp. NBC_01361 TaxID=2903838 RepID=UPI002E346DE7|nr:hypothetical protein [Streptomyces sp. NBC_01361]